MARRDIKNYAAVTAAYWAFTLTDGALRMLVLLHFYRLGFSPVDLAFLFLLYEFMGVLTNLFGGWIGARFGLRLTLLSGLGVQIVALTMLSFTQPDWSVALSVAYVMASQALSGVAKDLTKMSSKSAIKVVVQEEGHSLLFRWVALLTGSKNALKGVGFFLGGALLAGIGFQGALLAMAGALAVILAALIALLNEDLGKAKTKVRRSELFSKTREINWLSAARIFLFASRDVWFVVAVPIFLYDQLGWSFDRVGAFMALWVIGYGVVQAGAPRLLRTTDSPETGARAALSWGLLLTGTTGLLALAMTITPSAVLLIGGLLLFGIIFAVNSAVHSFLIVAYSDSDRVVLNVGFYYMANAIGRLTGTLLSGVIFQLSGLQGTLWAAAGLMAAAVLLTGPLVGTGNRSQPESG
ncbi:MAG: organoarsenical effux MFS transporter ArsJ [Alphaproteobacteria bacterium]|nr:organoarsenical effux MFS transporter ArsJ [Alphaproteobacteria bacterium]